MIHILDPGLSPVAKTQRKDFYVSFGSQIIVIKISTSQNKFSMIMKMLPKEIRPMLVVSESDLYSVEKI